MRLFKKIDFYYLGDYLYSTLQARTCKEAKAKLLERLALRGETRLGLVESQILKNPKELKAYFAK